MLHDITFILSNPPKSVTNTVLTNRSLFSVEDILKFTVDMNYLNTLLNRIPLLCLT